MALREDSTDQGLRWSLGFLMLLRLLYPFFDSPLTHLFSDPLRHWNNGLRFPDPDMIGAGDPYLYQLWLYLVRHISGDSSAWIQLSCGVLCAAMPYGWYRALKELVPRSEALSGAIIIGLVPSFLGIYSYFMTETLMLTLTGFTFWLTLRAWRKNDIGAWVICGALWTITVFTRVVALPMAAGCLATLWIAQSQRLVRALILVVLVAALVLPAAMHSKKALGFMAPLGNTYITDIYNVSGKHDISIEGGVAGRFTFGSPSFYNATFYPFSKWTTDRRGVVAIHIDPSKGRATWKEERARAAAESTMPYVVRLRENLLYLLFGQSWPDNDRRSIIGWLNVWTRWLWAPLVTYVAVGVLRRRYCGLEWLLPLCGLGMVVFLAIQTTAIMEGRYRKPIEPILLAAATVQFFRSRQRSSIQGRLDLWRQTAEDASAEPL